MVVLGHVARGDSDKSCQVHDEFMLVTSLQHNLVDRHGEQQADVVRAHAHLWHSGAPLAAWAKFGLVSRH